MAKNCKGNNHLWTVKSKSNILLTRLDLMLGRRCQCGDMVIAHDCLENQPGNMFQVIAINSPAGKQFADANPKLKTW